MGSTGLCPCCGLNYVQAWAPSTKECYCPKWEAFKAWCSVKSLDPFNCPLQCVLEYLNILLERKLAPATIRVYASAMNVHCYREAEPIFTSHAGQLFFKGLARARPPKRPAPPSWDLAKVLDMLSRAPFEPLVRASDHHLSVKTAFLLAVCTGFRERDLVGLSIQDGCLILQEDLSQVTLKPNPAFVGKSGPMANIRPVTLYAFPPSR